MHAGDISGHGNMDEAIRFLDWFAEQDYDHLIMIAGNHDFIFEMEPEKMKEECDKRFITLLNDSGITLKSMDDPALNLKIWGSPVQPWFHDWAFNRQRGPDIKKHWDLIPPDTEILLTHGPPYGILDVVGYVDGTPKERVGCHDMLEKIATLKELRLHVFGHIHEARGVHYEKNTTFINASSLDRMYSPASRKPIRVTREVVQDGSVVYIA